MATIDKLSLSLDDIIKINKKEKMRQKQKPHKGYVTNTKIKAFRAKIGTKSVRQQNRVDQNMRQTGSFNKRVNNNSFRQTQNNRRMMGGAKNRAMQSVKAAKQTLARKQAWQANQKVNRQNTYNQRRPGLQSTNFRPANSRAQQMRRMQQATSQPVKLRRNTPVGGMRSDQILSQQKQRKWGRVNQAANNDNIMSVTLANKPSGDTRVFLGRQQELAQTLAQNRPQNRPQQQQMRQPQNRQNQTNRQPGNQRRQQQNRNQRQINLNNFSPTSTAQTLDTRFGYNQQRRQQPEQQYNQRSQQFNRQQQQPRQRSFQQQRQPFRQPNKQQNIQPFRQPNRQQNNQQSERMVFF